MSEITEQWLDLQLFAAGTGETPDPADPDEDWDVEDEGIDEDYLDNEDEDDEGEDGDDEDDGDEEKPALKGQDPKTNEAFAKIRRRAEAAEKAAKEAAQKVAAFEAQRQQAQEQATADQFSQTERQIATLKAGLTQYQKQIEAQRISDGYDPAIAAIMARQEMYERKDLIREAEIQLANMKAAQNEQKRQRDAEQERFRNRVMADHEALRTKFGSIVPDIKDLDEEVASRVLAGESLKAVWLEVNFDRIADLKAKAAAKRGREQAQSKKHLHGEKSGDIDVDTTAIPPEIFAMYKSVNPKWSDAEIAKDYKAQKRKRK